jgi:F-type H+-transporting ATPase subunit epsilon
MQTKKLHLKIVTPERTILEEDVDQVTLPTTEGEITILPDHIPLISTLKAGELVAVSNGEVIPMAVVGGFIEVKPASAKPSAGEVITEVAVLADFAEPVAELTDEAIEKAKTHAADLQEKQKKGEVVDFEHFEAELEKSLNRVKIADKWRSKKYRK